jgi:hypothetical protein
VQLHRVQVVDKSTRDMYVLMQSCDVLMAEMPAVDKLLSQMCVCMQVGPLSVEPYYMQCQHQEDARHAGAEHGGRFEVVAFLLLFVVAGLL